MAHYQDTHPGAPLSGSQHGRVPERAWAGGWLSGPVGRVGLVVAVLMAVPLLASLTSRDAAVLTPVARERGAAASAAAPDDTRSKTQATAAPAAPAAVPGDAEPQAVSTLPEPTRQMIAKCVENGRVVYTQTGSCAGSITAVPIDTQRNVVGPDTGNNPAAQR